jgi:hypothetical protein
MNILVAVLFEQKLGHSTAGAARTAKDDRSRCGYLTKSTAQLSQCDIDCSRCVPACELPCRSNVDKQRAIPLKLRQQVLSLPSLNQGKPNAKWQKGQATEVTDDDG